MLVEVKVPPLAESVADATLMSWHKRPGEAVAQGESLIDLETDKVTLEVTAPVAGVLKEIARSEGETALAGEVLAVIDTDAAVTATAAQADAAAPATGATAAADAPRMSPAVRKLVTEHALDPGRISGSGKDGRITKGDVVAHLESAPAPDAEPPAPPPAAPMPAGARPEERVPMTRLRRRTAERLLAAQHDNALLTTFNEVNMQPVTDLRDRYRERFEKDHGVRLGFMSFFAKAAVAALKRFPIVNASVDGEDIVYRGYFDVGIAVASPRGLVVPIVRDVDTMSFGQVEAQIRALGEKARSGQLAIEDLTGGTFTITNGGVFGSLLSTPIINPPQSAILGMHKIQDRPVAENGAVVIRPMMYLALSYDHRIIDGREAVQFLVTIKDLLEDPARMLLEV
ncbi:MAG: 2-oxoglutarate dehydrogenase complex dihydrolipoyllysine-residue succinyltransferase [Gammaproteobacteria bacterium]|nr:2-oxoglutarate dehydrogenase complex dihydrolipoyllysine-residue succinyltransferase [Gammaproteobacteria bacterium]